MNSRPREKLVTQVDSEILAAVQHLAQTEEQQLEALVDEELADLIEKRQQGSPRPHVMAAYQSSHAAFGSLYEKLAKAEDIMNRYGKTLNSLEQFVITL